MKKKISIILLTALMFAAVFMLGRDTSEKRTVVINEVRSWDADVTRYGFYGSDYIELYNTTSEAMSLHGWYVSDDETDLQKSQLSDVMIDGNGYLLIYANGTNATGDSVNFKINPAGEKIFLSDSSGNLIDGIYVPRQEFGTVYARKTDGEDIWCIQRATTNFSNNEAEILPSRSLEKPQFSHESGFYEEEFILTLQAKKGETIYYTLDGSKPSTDSLLYTDGIAIKDKSSEPNVLSSVRKVVWDWENYFPSEEPVDKATIVRAVAVNAQGEASEITTNTYFVNLEKYKEKNVVSLVSDFDEMFGDEGIFVTGKACDEGTASVPNFLFSGRNWEIQGNMEVIQKGNVLLDQEIGIRTQGASTRQTPKKKMSIFAREEYSGSPYFEGWAPGNLKTHSVYTNHSISNIVFPELLKDRSLEVQDAQECTVFLNGEYWYDTYLLEKYNKYYFHEKYQVNPDNLIVIKDKSETEGPEDSYGQYWTMLEQAASMELSDSEQYEVIGQMIDIQSYIDYICANVYLCNMDISENKNTMIWRTIANEGSEKGDGRWRWIIYDVDCLEWVSTGFYGVEERAAINSFSSPMEYADGTVNSLILYSSLKNSEEFRKQFVTTFLDMANVNFSVENVEQAFKKWNTVPEEKFGGFFERRFDFIVPYLAEEFGLTGSLETVNLTINDVEGGKVFLNTTLPNMSKGSWTGKYYTDYPITVTAVPNEGYRFVGWSGSINSGSATIETEILQGGITLEAIFEKTES